ncbi:transporter [Ganoderma sinense ZZ0214-1]|uniref:Transporter n=1 Tax=Ganoderma sinense ZZ0214-1 TaxID=1077348 RepID=A0A2G8RQH2_9APHY|nr:transporter [Ganoderma sinense ZZ0214-1]
MPPYLLSRDSPRAQHGRRRPPRAQLARSGSLIGALKNIVSAPLAWFTSYDDQENLSGKRGRTATNAILEDEGTYHEDQPSAKRKRVDSPEPPVPLSQLAPRSIKGYLDVPDDLLSRPTGSRNRSGAQPGHGRSSSMVAPLSIPAVQGAHPARRTASPAGILAPGQLIAAQRTQSMDPPQYRALSLSRDVSMEDGQLGSATRDVTMSPSRRDPFQLRARNSLTPQPTGQAFGPNVRHKERDTSEPPPLAALMSKPQFVKPPLQTAPGQAGQDFTTLGSLAEAKGRVSRSPMRQHSGLFLGARPGTISESDSSYSIPINAAEKALIDLDVYKTPLLPSRLHGAGALPDMFKPKKSHAPVLMRSDSDRAHKPRLGTAEKKGKKKEKVEEIAPKPYAGRGGMKKMLARRKREEQVELEKERENAIEEDQDEVAQLVAEKGTIQATEETPRLPSPPAAPAPSSRPVGGREQSSLRVGRTRTSRNHIARPVSKAKNRFSAAFDEDEGEEANEESREEEPKKLPTLFESPKGFTFAQDKAPVLHDSSNAKEPPISALPFSFGKPTAAPSAAPSGLAQPFSFAQPPKMPPQAPESAQVTNGNLTVKASEPAPVTPAKTVPSVPSISLIPPSPAPAKPAVDAAAVKDATTSTSIPNFFASSSVFSKSGVTIGPPAPSPAPVVQSKEEAKPAALPSLFGGLPSFAPSATAKETSATTTEPPKVMTALAFSFASPASTPAPAPATSTPAPSSGFSFASIGQVKDTTTAQPTPSLFSNSVPTKEAAPQTKAPATASSPFSFGTSVIKVADTSTAPTSLPFSFGTPVVKPATTAAPATSPSPAPFTFGQTKPEAAKAPEVKPLLGASEPAKPSLFGPPPVSSSSPFGASQATGVTEAPKPAFSFGTPPPSTPAPTVEAPKPLFPSASTGGTGGFTFASTAPSAASPATPAKTPFSFGVAPATPPVTTPVDNKPAFSFGASTTPTVSAPTTLFGGPSTGSNGGDVPKPFTFGSCAPARPITPPQKEQEMRMEESPTRGGGMDINGEVKPSTGFAFGTSSASASGPFGQPSQTSSGPFAFGKTETKLEVKPVPTFGGFGQGATSSPFAFGSKPAEGVQSPISPAPFGSSAPFGQAASTPTSTSPFTFGAPSGGASGGFGQPSTGIGSQPASPSTFGQPSSNPFTFGVTPTSATTPSNPFAFGSQPASPANGNTGLPQPPGSSGGPAFTFGAQSSATQAPSSPFGAAPPLHASGGVGFTIGSAAPQQVAPGARQIKKLPTRNRGGRIR